MNCKCRKKVVDKLVEECNENIDDKELHPNKMICNSTLNDYEKICSCCKCCSCQNIHCFFFIFFIISLSICRVFFFFFFFFHWYLKRKYFEQQSIEFNSVEHINGKFKQIIIKNPAYCFSNDKINI